MEKLAFRAMGCQMLAVLDGPVFRAAERLKLVPGWFEEWEDSLSRFRPDSELNRLNAQPETAVRLSRTLWEVLQAAIEAFRESRGLVTPTVLDALTMAGYDRSFDLITGPGMNVGTAAVPAPQLDKVLELDEVMRSARLAAGVHLDLGGVAKGWAAHQAVRRLDSYAPALVDASGDIAVSGPRRDGSPWIGGIANPFDPQSDLGILSITGGGVATSGRDYHRWRQGNTWQHHLIDPRTGMPAETDVLSVTVTAPTVMEAETVAKTALILGSQVGLAWLNHQPGLEGLIVLENGQRLQSQNFQNIFLETL